MGSRRRRTQLDDIAPPVAKFRPTELLVECPLEKEGPRFEKSKAARRAADLADTAQLRDAASVAPRSAKLWYNFVARRAARTLTTSS